MNELGVMVWRIFLHQRTNIRWLMFFFYLIVQTIQIKNIKSPFGILLKNQHWNPEEKYLIRIFLCTVIF